MIWQAAQTVAAFNLVCTGTYTSGQFMGRTEERRPAAIVFRVDLDSGRWCSGDCTTTASIQRVSETQIVFRQRGDIMHSQSGDMTDEGTIVNRENGELLDRERYWLGNQMRYRMITGTCERAPFSGFPARRF